MRRRILLVQVAVAPLAAACGAEAQRAVPTSVPAVVPTAAPPPPMADKIILYGDMALFAGADNPESCTLRSRFKRGEAVGFRMTAIYPLTGQYAETAALTVKLANGVDIPMNWRGTGSNPRNWLWTGKWVIPADAPLGITRYTVEGKDKDGKTGKFAPFDVENSQLTIVA
jgi:hypothetical protein